MLISSVQGLHQFGLPSEMWRFAMISIIGIRCWIELTLDRAIKCRRKSSLGLLFRNFMIHIVGLEARNQFQAH